MEGTGHQAGNGSALEAPKLKERIEGARERLEDLDARARRFVAEQPLGAVGAALAVGYLVGRLLRNR